VVQEVEVEVAVVVHGVVGVGGKQSMMRNPYISLKSAGVLGRRMIRRLVLLTLSVAFASLACASAWAQQSSPASPGSAQKSFDSPQQAADALIRAASTDDVPALLAIFGPDGNDLISSADPVRDKNMAIAFAAKAREKKEVTLDPKNPKSAVLFVGNDDWPLPIPIIETNGKWSFDTKAGREEIVYRRIGANELDAIQICRGYVEAQHEYAMEKHDGAEVNQYAQRVISTPGKHDGLVWRNPDGTLGGPIAEEIADALQQGYTNRGQPFHGYYFKILKGQGPAAPMGQMDFVVNGAMIGGFALVAAPADYRVTGVKTFLVGYDGIVYEKDLGPDTLNIFKDMELYNPDKTWHRTNDNW
jgi:Protein of unknown function (DUF2950)